MLNFLCIVYINDTNSSKIIRRKCLGMEIFVGDNFNHERNQEDDKTKRGKNFPEKSSSVLNWIEMNFERSRTPRTHHRHFWLVEIYICIWTGAYSFDKSCFFNGHSLDSKRNSLLTHLSKLHDIIRTFTNDQSLNLGEKYSRIEYWVAENRKFPVKERGN